MWSVAVNENVSGRSVFSTFDDVAGACAELLNSLNDVYSSLSTYLGVRGFLVSMMICSV